MNQRQFHASMPADLPPLQHSLHNKHSDMTQPSVSDAYHLHSSTSLNSLSPPGHRNNGFQILPPSMSSDSSLLMSSSQGSHGSSQYGIMSPPLEQSIPVHHSTHTSNHIQHAQQYNAMSSSLEQTHMHQ